MPPVHVQQKDTPIIAPALLADQHYERLAKIVEGGHDKAIAYSKVVLGLGYAALFTVWAGTKNDLSHFQRILSALLAVSSLFFYIVYEIGQMFFYGALGFKFPKLLEKHQQDMGAALQEYSELETRRARKLRTAWFVNLFLTVPPGLGAAGVLIWALVARLKH